MSLIISFHTQEEKTRTREQITLIKIHFTFNIVVVVVVAASYSECVFLVYKNPRLNTLFLTLSFSLSLLLFIFVSYYLERRFFSSCRVAFFFVIRGFNCIHRSSTIWFIFNYYIQKDTLVLTWWLSSRKYYSITRVRII